MDNITNNLTNKGIYKITCLSNNKFYIGSSIGIKGRIRSHFASLRKNEHKNKHLQSAFNKYGESYFIIECIKACPITATQEEVILIEQKYLDTLKPWESKTGFNISQVAAMPPNQKICRSGWIDSRKGKTYKDIYGDEWRIQRQKLINAHKGKSLTEEHKQSISKALKGRHTSTQHRQNLSKAIKGRILSTAHKQNISKAKKGKINNTTLLCLIQIKTNLILTKPIGEWRKLKIATYPLIHKRISTSKGWKLYSSVNPP